MNYFRYKLPPYWLETTLKVLLGLVLLTGIFTQCSILFDKYLMSHSAGEQINDPAWTKIPPTSRIHASKQSDKQLNQIFRNSLHQLTSARITSFSIKNEKIKNSNFFHIYNPSQTMRLVRVGLNISYPDLTTLIRSLQQQPHLILWKKCDYDATEYPHNHADLAFYML